MALNIFTHKIENYCKIVLSECNIIMSRLSTKKFINICMRSIYTPCGQSILFDFFFIYLTTTTTTSYFAVKMKPFYGIWVGSEMDKLLQCILCNL